MQIPWLIPGQSVTILARNLDITQGGNNSTGLQRITATVNSVGREGVYVTIPDGGEILLSHSCYEWIRPTILIDTGVTYRSAGTMIQDRSDSIHVGGVAQWVMADYPGRRYMFLQNNSAGDLWWSLTGAEAVIGKPSFRLTPGSSASDFDEFVIGNRLSVIGATTNQEFTANEDGVSQIQGVNWTGSMLAYWHLNEIGGTRYDGWTGKNHLTDNATVGSGTGKVGNAAAFVGASSEFLSLPYDATKQLFHLGPQDLAVSLWIKPTAGTAAPIVGQGDPSFGPSGLGWMLELNEATGVITFTVGNGFLSTQVTMTGVTNGAWNHVYFRYNNVNQTIRAFVNNVGSGSVASVVPGDAVGELTLGAYPVTHSAFYTGSIDELIILRRALSASEITALFDYGTAGQTIPFTP